MKSDKKTQITLEDLLRLKRVERPPAEFWSQFERELRAKQLSAIVVRRPMWRTLPQRMWGALARYHLPLGASAVLALTFVSIREYQVGAGRGAIPTRSDAAVSSSAAVAGTGVEPEATIASTTTSGLSSMTVDESATMVSSGGSESVAAESRSSLHPEALAGDVSAMNALVGVAGSEENEKAGSPSARSIANNFGAMQSSSEGPLNRSLLGAKHGFESRVMPAPARTVDPLAQVTPPGQVRNARYLGTALPVSASKSSISNRSSERLVSRLSDDRLYDSISRYAFSGDNMSVKF